MQRALCPVETLYVGQRSRAVLSCTLHGHVDVEALSAAFDAVTAAQPTLRARIVPDGTGYALRLLDEESRPRLITRTGDAEEAHAAELNSPLPVGSPLTRAVLVSAPDGDQHLFVLTIDHTITDGHSALTLHNILWDRYREIVEADGEHREAVPSAAAVVTEDRVDGPQWPSPVSLSLPRGDEADTAAYLERRTEEARQHPVELVAYDVPAGTEDGHVEACRLTLDPEDTTRLRQAARRAGVSVHALVSAAVLGAARRRLAGDGARTLGCLSPVDLRSRMSPPLPAAVAVAAVTSHLQTVEVSEETEPLALARTVHARIGEYIARGDHFREVLITPEIPRNPALQLGTVIVTNMGVVPGPRLPEGLRASDVRLVPGRENYFPQMGRSPVMACVVSCEGRLAIEFPHFTACFSPSFMAAFRDDVRDGLLAFTGTAEPEPALADAR
ncbi:phthiocerol/phthiodiolone dimycocerosyl transferase family protein [Streptomyces sp. CRN 30]|uniref:phthiocerol/phthiodiolone dimycocerosyl transferase family protein n=1 Tax=Streptomyces sp. CRN 30 TaxID=3075613 RepID=UPI002A83CF16|nr:protein kinase [Streptomyces sp. CRN 30]